MVSAYILTKYGDVADLSLKRGLVMPKLKNDEALIKHRALGINYFDIEVMRGDYGPQPPFVPGAEVVGVVEAKGKDVSNFNVGDRVAYCSLGTGGFAEQSVVSARHLVKIPNLVSDEIAAAGYLKGMVAMMLLTRVFMATAGARIMVFGASGGMGHVITQFAKNLDCDVVGIVGSASNIEIAEGNGCDRVTTLDELITTTSGSKNFVTGGDGAHAIYDPIFSSQTLAISYKALSPFGIYVPFGQIAAENPKINCKTLQKKSLLVTKPLFFHYYARAFDTQLAASAVFNMLQSGKINPKINNIYSFKEIPKAYTALAKRKLNQANIVVF